MPLLGRKTYDYEVTLRDGDDIFTEYIIAKDAENAAWIALELSEYRTCTLQVVRLSDEW